MPLQFKTKLSQAQFNKLKGSIDEHQYRWDPEEKMFVKTMNTIKNIAEIKRKSPKYGLATKLGRTSGIMYLTEDNTFSDDKSKAKVFYSGFDLPEVQMQKYKVITGVNLYQVSLYDKPKV